MSPIERILISSSGDNDIDAFLDLQGHQGWCRVSLASSAGALRIFFRYAERYGWNRPRIAKAIDAPRLFKQEGLPNSPVWMDVQRLVVSTDGPDARDVRDHAMLFAAYGPQRRSAAFRVGLLPRPSFGVGTNRKAFGLCVHTASRSSVT